MLARKIHLEWKQTIANMEVMEFFLKKDFDNETMVGGIAKFSKANDLDCDTFSVKNQDI